MGPGRTQKRAGLERTLRASGGQRRQRGRFRRRVRARVPGGRRPRRDARPRRNACAGVQRGANVQRRCGSAHDRSEPRRVRCAWPGVHQVTRRHRAGGGQGRGQRAAHHQAGGQRLARTGDPARRARQLGSRGCGRRCRRPLRREPVGRHQAREGEDRADRRRTARQGCDRLVEDRPNGR